MEFNKGYYHALDRDYQLMNNLDGQSDTDKILNKPLLRISEIGTSVTEGGQFGRLRQSVTAALHRGVREIELSMSASGIQSGPASYSEKEREELREMARINNIRFTSTHVAPQSVGNISGLGRGGFSEEERQRQLNEIQQAIEFAGETALGGAVVVHTAEFPRSLSKYEKEGFTEFAGEAGKKERIHHFVDKRTGKVIPEFTVREDQSNFAFYYRTKDGKETTNKDEAAKDEWGLPVLYYDKNKNEYLTYEKDWTDYEKEAKEMHERGELIKGELPTAEKLFFRDTMNTQIEKAQSQVHRWEAEYEQRKQRASETLSQVRSYKQQLDTLPDEEKKLYAEQIGERLLNKELSPEQAKDFLELQEKNIEKEVNSLYEAVMSTNRQVKELEKIRDNTVPIETFAIDKSADSLAVLGIQAMKQTEESKRKYGKTDKVNNIFIAPENIFAEGGYGSHPDELINLVEKSRDKMTDMLIRQGYDKKKAISESNKHIKATFDTEHLGMWKRFFKNDPNKTQEENDKAFNNWYLKQVKKLAEKDIIGHVHLADTFGYGHGQLPPGQGKMPLKDAVQYLKEKGYKGTFESEGWGDPLRQETDAWTYFGSPIYAVGGRTGPSFDQIHQGYFRSISPYKSVTVPYYPSEDWKMWSEVPLD